MKVFLKKEIFKLSSKAQKPNAIDVFNRIWVQKSPKFLFE